MYKQFARTMEVDEFTRKLYEVYKESLKLKPKVWYILHVVAFCFIILHIYVADTININCVCAISVGCCVCQVSM